MAKFRVPKNRQKKGKVPRYNTQRAGGIKGSPYIKATVTKSTLTERTVQAGLSKDALWQTKGKAETIKGGIVKRQSWLEKQPVQVDVDEYDWEWQDSGKRYADLTKEARKMMRYSDELAAAREQWREVENQRRKIENTIQGSAMQGIGREQNERRKALDAELKAITKKQAETKHAVVSGTKGETFKDNMITSLHEAGATEEQIAIIEKMSADNIWHLWKMGYIGGEENYFDYDFVYDEWMDEFRALTQTRTVGMRRAQDLIDTYAMVF